MSITTAHWQRMIFIYSIAAWLLASVASAQPASRIQLTDVTAQSGMEFVHSDGGTGSRTIVESVVGGLATFDYDGDGLQDILLLSGIPLDQSFADGQSTSRATHALYRNLGNFRFSDVTQAAGLGKPGYGMGAVVADYDEDGDPDLYLSNFGRNILYRNCGDGTFVDSTDQAGLTLPEKVGAGCVFLDIDADHDLDLYVGSYVQFKLSEHKMRYIGAHAFHPGPTDYPASTDVLFRNDGNGSFTDVTTSSGVGAYPSYTMGVIAWDVDDDKDTDIMIANDQRPNTLLINDGRGHFEDQAVLCGFAFDRFGKANGNMGLDLGDVDGDGLLDVFTTTYQDEMPVLYKNLGAGLFIDQTNVAQIDGRMHPHVKWGCSLVDLDNDGDLDLYVGCGHFADNIQHIDDRTSVKVRDFVLENRGGKFVDVSAQAGSALTVIESSRGAAFEDFDNDGDLDAVVLNANAHALLIRNDTNPVAQGINVQLVGTRCNRSALGSRVVLKSALQTQTAEVIAGRGYQSHYGSRLHFATRPDHEAVVEIAWASGLSEQFSTSNFTHTSTLVEGCGTALQGP